MDRYVDLVTRTSFRILCDYSDSEYVTRVVFEIFKRKVNEDGLGMKPSLWFLEQTVRVARKRFRHNRFMNFFGRRPELYVQTAPKVDDVDDYITTQAWEIYCRTSEELTVDQRIVYVLMELEGLSEEDVMQITGFWRGTVRLALEIARAGIRYELSKFGRVTDYEAYVGFLRRVHYIRGSKT